MARKKLKTPLLKETGVAAGKKTREDAQLLKKAIQQRWPIPAELRPEIVERLAGVAMNTKGEHADANAMRAAGVLVAMDGQNQTDDQLREKNIRLDLGKATERVEIEQVIIEKPVRPK